MLLRGVLHRFEKESPFTVMAHLGLVQALQPEWVNDVFEKHSDGQYTRTLLFSTVVEAMALVSLGLSPSVHAAAKSLGEQLTVSLTSLYNKINDATRRALVMSDQGRKGPTFPQVVAYSDMRHGRYEARKTMYRMSCKGGRGTARETGHWQLLRR